jgi:hypothetical protein
MSNNIFEFQGTIVIPATTSKFVAKDQFKKIKNRVSYLGVNFYNWFLAGDGKIEDLIPQITLRYAKLLSDIRDVKIIAELGGEAKVEVALAEVYYLMEQQKNGEGGVLLINNYTNVFYIKDVNGVLRAVDVQSFGSGWYVSASSIADPDGWREGDQFFSHDS